MEFDSHSRNSSSCSVGTRPFGFIARYAGSLFLPNGPPISMRLCGRPSSPTAHITFCTLTEVFRPQILIIAIPLARSSVCRPAVFSNAKPPRRYPACALGEGNHNAGASIQPSCLLGQHDRDAAADRIGKLGG